MSTNATTAKAASHKLNRDQRRVAGAPGASAFGVARAGFLCGWRIVADLRRLRVTVAGQSHEAAGT